jgi:hypothetical protein
VWQAFAGGVQLPVRLFRLLRGGPAWKHFRKVTLVRSALTALMVLLVGYYGPHPKTSRAEVPRHARAVHKAPRPAGLHVEVGDDADDETDAVAAATKLTPHDEDDDEPKSTLPLPLEWLVWLYGIMWPVQWLVVALSRDYDDLFASQLALSAGAAQEPAPAIPRARLDFGWLWLQTKRRLWALLAWAPGVGVIALLCLPFPAAAREAISAALGGLWLAYWWVVGTTAKSSVAWAKGPSAGPPFFLRGLQRVTAKIPLVRSLVALWARATRRLYPAAEALESAPAVLAGVALFRTLASVPLLSLWARPLLPVAVSLTLAASQPSPRGGEGGRSEARPDEGTSSLISLRTAP